MAKKKSTSATTSSKQASSKSTPAGSGKAAAKAAKKAKAASKADKKAKKKEANDDLDDDGQDLEAILEQMRKDWEDAHKVTEEVALGPPSQRANATLTACPNGNHLWCVGGEYFTEDGKAHFYNDVYRYSPDKDEWRKFVTPTCPGPRSAHAVVASPISGGKLFLFGGEFSSLHQTTFYHYKDFWAFDIPTHTWSRIEPCLPKSKHRGGAGGPAAPCGRSGHRMVMWKQYVVLFGGFVDPGIRTQYLNDLWLFDLEEYKWIRIDMKDNERKPSPRSGFSFLPHPDGAILHGGYCKEYTKGKRPVGIALDDTWALELTLPSVPDSTASSSATTSAITTAISTNPIAKWVKRKKAGYAPNPSPRSGCTMAYWANKSMGILFGGVIDQETPDGEGLESVFLNDLYGYITNVGQGKWVGLSLKTVAVGKKKKDKDKAPTEEQLAAEKEREESIPLGRYNTMLAVLRNTLYIYGGIYERGTREYTLDDFHSLQLDKLDKFICLKESAVLPDLEHPELDESSDEGEDEGEDDDDNDDENEDSIDDELEDEVEEDGIVEIEANTNEEAAPVEKDRTGGANVILSEGGEVGESEKTEEKEDATRTPLPFEALAAFYSRTKSHWASLLPPSLDQKAVRREGFALAEERWKAYRPEQEKLERILRESGVGKSEVVYGGSKGGAGGVVESRNRR